MYSKRLNDSICFNLISRRGWFQSRPVFLNFFIFLTIWRHPYIKFSNKFYLSSSVLISPIIRCFVICCFDNELYKNILIHTLKYPFIFSIKIIVSVYTRRPAKNLNMAREHFLRLFLENGLLKAYFPSKVKSNRSISYFNGPQRPI